jgi:hypothetical protein
LFFHLCSFLTPPPMRNPADARERERERERGEELDRISRAATKP